jgi:hypothetical protein
MDKKFLTAAEVSELFGVSNDVLDSWIEQGLVRPLADRGTFKYRVEEVERALEGVSPDEAHPGGQVLAFGNSDDSSLMSALEVGSMAEDETVISKEPDVAKYLAKNETAGDDLSSLADDLDSLFDPTSADEAASAGVQQTPAAAADTPIDFADDLLGFEREQEAAPSVEESPEMSAAFDDAVVDEELSLSDSVLDEIDDSTASSEDDSGLALEAGDSGISLDAGDSGIALETGDSGISLETGDSGLALEAGDSGLALETGDSGISLDAGDSGLTLEAGESGLTLAADDDDGFSTELLEGGVPVSDRTEPDLDATAHMSPDEFWDDEPAAFANISDTTHDGIDDDATSMIATDEAPSEEFSEDDVAASLDSALSDQDIAAEGDDEEVEDFLEADDEAFSEEFSAAEDEDEFSEESFAALPVKAGPREPSWGALASISVIAASAVIAVSGLIVWEGVSTMWTGAEPSGPGAALVSTLSGLLG